MIKSDHEIALMRLASKVTLAAYEAAYHALNEGMTQQQFEDLIEAAHKQLGFSGGADVQVGEYSAFPHGSVATQVIREGTIVLMDGGCKVEGYSSDITRTFVLGKPSGKLGIPARVSGYTGNSGRHDCVNGWRMQSGRLHLRHHAHVRS